MFQSFSPKKSELPHRNENGNISLYASPNNDKEIKENNDENQSLLKGKSLCLFGQKNRFRIFLLKLISSNYFETFIMLTIIMSCILLLIKDPLENPNSQYNQNLFVTDYIILVIYFLELTAKVIVYGLIFNGEKSFLRNLNNFFDFALLIMTFIGTLDELLRFSNNSLKSFRVVRFVKIIWFFPESKKSVKILVASIPDLLGVFIYFFFNLLFFGLISMQYFKNQLYFCSNYDKGLKIVTKWDCLDYGGDWLNQDVNFDNIINAVSGIFQLSTTEAWMKIM